MDVVTVGWLTRDDIVTTDGRCQMDVPGGGALYSAIGAQIWTRHVGIHSVTGRDVLDATLQTLAERGIDTRGVEGIDGNGLQLWLLHESDKDKQQVPKLSSSKAEDMDRGRGPLPASYAAARGFHVAPQTPAGSFATAARLHAFARRPVVTLDLLSDDFIDRRLYADLGFLNAVTAFLPSEAEVERIWSPPDLQAWMRETATAHGCHLGVKLGDRGSIVCDGQSGAMTRIPAYSARVVDTTGAGDGYCGGFLAGLVAGRPLVECAAMGTVSASFIIESYGALRTATPGPADCEARFRSVLADAYQLKS
jgi:sugar/nucleoside kinase (ribokinase family)